jgi:hypothetical protein
MAIYSSVMREKRKRRNQNHADKNTPATISEREKLRKNTCIIVMEALKNVRTAPTVRVRRRKGFLTDGPFAETKEQLGGFFPNKR